VITITCARSECRGTREVYPSQIKRKAKRFCSRSCKTIYLNQTSPSLRASRKRHKAPWLSERNKRVNADQSRRTASQRSKTLREKNEKMRGGKPRRGYLSTYTEGKGSRHTHRIIAENKIGRKLRKGEIVHHRDGNIHNNKASNLEIISRAEHMDIHVHKRR